MNNLSFKQKIIGAVVAIGLVLIAIFKMGFGGMGTPINTETAQKTTENIKSDEISLVSKTPANLSEDQNTFILPNQEITFTFNAPLIAEAETKIIIDPPQDLTLKLSDDKKTIKVTPVKPFPLGGGVTLFIKADTKFEGKKTLNRDYVFHLNTINYSGI